MIYTGTAQTTDWSHELFGNINFSVSTYQQQMADYLYENHDWDGEPNTFKTDAENIFGSNWKLEVSNAVSWIGLESTSQYYDYLNDYSSQGNFQKLQYITDIKNKIANANVNCP